MVNTGSTTLTVLLVIEKLPEPPITSAMLRLEIVPVRLNAAIAVVIPDPATPVQSIAAARVIVLAPENELTCTSTSVTVAFNAPPSCNDPPALSITSADHLRVSPAITSAALGCRVATLSVATLTDTPNDEESVSPVRLNTSSRAPVSAGVATFTVLFAIEKLPLPPITSAIDSDEIVPLKLNAEIAVVIPEPATPVQSIAAANVAAFAPLKEFT